MTAGPRPGQLQESHFVSPPDGAQGGQSRRFGRDAATASPRQRAAFHLEAVLRRIGVYAASSSTRTKGKGWGTG